uniref:NADH-ubiquinone oxidoreductase chain 2 n=1 Tax=Torquigener pleurogramma TaxID=303748 RepID=F2EMT2_9TELE|nr:NADH dehydrogenase subunit 2 [Torquigener pleurogramma]BAK09900.1 NADH dehydrogenase subunit 2 [Torquigener pleurogramma]
MNPYITTSLLFGLLLGTTITTTSTHWLIAWMGLEINTLAIIPLMAQQHHPRAIEATTKYFLTQAAAAATLLLAATTNAWMDGQWELQQTTHPIPTTMITIALALKIGLAPLHTWLPEVMQGLSLTTGLVLATWQKIAPFSLLLQIQPNNQTLLVTLALLSMLVGGWGGLNQTQVRKILAYSSIAHLGWMIIILQFSTTLAVMTLALYIVMTSSTFLVFMMSKATTIGTLTISWAKAPVITTLMPLILLSLGGLPPLTGFMPKWLILQELTKQDLGVTATLAALSALLSLYFYLRLSYAMTLTVAPNNLTGTLPWRTPTNKKTLPAAILISSSMLLLPLTPEVLSLFNT